ncbi:hypothetical protein [Isoptericola sp. b408]|uniref:hypothetical protein n=1 Tax=Isoptericola sp. b408 TaxID=3064653 RepID=UPI002712DDE0|nr:hypothetical protein [Isoptericola sp. b408]MDO8150030.1 hypothetical protein [Isoptericola sp. b408]
MTTAQPGTVMVDRYRLNQHAATDLAAAEAWEAHDQILDRPVRVTFVTGPQAPAAIDAARRAALVADPRLCRVLDVGSTDLGTGEVSYVITEPYTGESLTQIVSRGLVDAQQARALMGEAATALESARQRGVHHLALRPEAVRVYGHRVVVTGLGIDAGLADAEAAGSDAAARDARGVVALGYYALTARWPGEALDVSWIAPDAVRPLPAQTGPHGVLGVSELVPHVDEQIDELVRRTFGDEGQAPADPGEVVATLEPWGQVSVLGSLPQFVQPTPERPVRSSVLGAGSPAGTESLPGTPPPAPPVRRPSSGRIARGAAMGGAAGAAYGAAQGGYAQQPTQAQPPAYGQQAPYGQAPAAAPGQVPPPPPGAGYGPAAAGSPTTGSFDSTAAPRRRGVNPTPIVLAMILVGVVIAAVWAVSQALSPFDVTTVAEDPSQEPAPAASEGTDGSSGEGGEPEPTESESPEVRPIIEAGSEIDPLGNGEKPEKVEFAFDSDPSTFWHTYTYENDPVFGGFKEGLGYQVELREPAPVTEIELNTNSEGGAWELRRVGSDAPENGEVLASGSYSSDTVIELDEPVVMDGFVLWTSELPTSEGEFRLELNEITVS